MQSEGELEGCPVAFGVKPAEYGFSAVVGFVDFVDFVDNFLADGVGVVVIVDLRYSFLLQSENLEIASFFSAFVDVVEGPVDVFVSFVLPPVFWQLVDVGEDVDHASVFVV